MEMGVIWSDWIGQPPQHRALYLAVRDARRRMDAVDESEARQKADLDRQRGQARGRR